MEWVFPERVTSSKAHKGTYRRAGCALSRPPGSGGWRGRMRHGIMLAGGGDALPGPRGPAGPSAGAGRDAGRPGRGDARDLYERNGTKDGAELMLSGNALSCVLRPPACRPVPEPGGERGPSRLHRRDRRAGDQRHQAPDPPADVPTR